MELKLDCSRFIIGWEIIEHMWKHLVGRTRAALRISFRVNVWCYLNDCFRQTCCYFSQSTQLWVLSFHFATFRIHINCFNEVKPNNLIQFLCVFSIVKKNALFFTQNNTHRVKTLIESIVEHNSLWWILNKSIKW